MSQNLAAAAQALNAPEALVLRSAEARAKATGSPVEDILSAWAGGVPAAAAPAEPAAAAPAVEAVEVAEAAAAESAPEAAAPEPVTPRPVAVAAAAAPVVAAAPPVVIEEEPFEAAPLGARVRKAGRIGAITGAAAGLLLVVVAAQWLVPRATMVGEQGAFRPAVEIVPGWLIGGFVLLSLAIGAAIGVFARSSTGWFGRGYRLVSSNRVTVILGAAVGGLMGALIGSVVVSAGTPSEVTEGITTVPFLSGVVWSVLGFAAMGWVVGALVEALGVPAGVGGEEAEESTAVRSRLASAYRIPVLAAMAILVLVLPMAYVFIQFPTWAPFLAIFVAGSILAFAGLSASRPGTKITAGEFLMAAVGIGVVIAIVAAVLATQGAGHEEGEDHSSEASAVLVAI